MSILDKLFFNRREKRFVSIEIGITWLKAAKAELCPAGRKITKLNIKKIVSLKENFAKGLADMLEELDIRNCTVITYFPRHLASIKILELPSMDKNEIADIIELQAVKQTPYSKEEVITNFKILGPGAKEGYTRIMLVIARKSIINERIKLFQEAGFETRFIGLSSEMVFNLYQQFLRNKHISGKDTTVGFIDMDSNFTDFLFIHNNNLLFTRSIFIGMENILAEPEIWKDKFAGQIKSSIDIYREHGLSGSLNKIIIGRAAAETEGLLELLKKTLNLPVEVLNVLENVPISEEALKTIKNCDKKVSLSAIFGSLLSDKEPVFNLMPRQIQMRKKLEERSKQVILSGILLVSIMMAASGILIERIYNKNSFLKTLTQQVIRTDKEAGRTERMKLKIDMIRRYLDKKQSSVNCLRQLYEIIPDEIHFASVAYNHGKELILTGSSDAMSTVFKFVTVLENLEYFEKIKTNYVTKKKRKGKEVVDFELVCPVAE
ncbi:MAG: pilus assembly protein PilM [Candidatus Omnitrophota bacterium]|nr:pilus assembly protein PilM [Candidatus Omnitrophota bacterium]